MKQITVEEVHYYISNPNYSEELHKQALELRKEICELDMQHGSLVEDIYETSQVSVHYDSNGGSASGKKKDLADLLLITKRMIEEHREELTLKYRVLLEHMVQCHRLRLTFETLDATSREVLNRLYVKKEKWEWIEHDLGLSHRKMVTVRKDAILMMHSRYNSELTNRQLAEWYEHSPFQETKRESKKKNIEGQLSLAAMFNGKEGSAT